MAKTLKKTIIKHLDELKTMTPDERIMGRIDKYSKIGVYANATEIIE